MTSGGLNLVEMSREGRGKGRALLEILQRLGLEPEQAAAIGDEQNDLDMLHSIPLGFAMNSARQEIKNQVPYTIGSVHELIDACLRYNAVCASDEAGTAWTSP